MWVVCVCTSGEFVNESLLLRGVMYAVFIHMCICVHVRVYKFVYLLCGRIFVYMHICVCGLVGMCTSACSSSCEMQLSITLATDRAWRVRGSLREQISCGHQTLTLNHTHYYYMRMKC